MTNIPISKDARQELIRRMVRAATQAAIEAIETCRSEYAREYLAVYGHLIRMDETDEFVLIAAGYELADRLYEKTK